MASWIRREAETPQEPRDPRVLEKFAYVVSSGQREKILGAVIPSPKTPAQIGRQTGLRLPHVSRALAQLQKAELVTRITDTRQGRLYVATELGRHVYDELVESRGDRLVAPMLRGTHFKLYHSWIHERFGRESADDVFLEVGVDPSRIDAGGWYPLRTAMRALDLIEERFGDGSYGTIRRMFQDIAGRFPSVRRHVARLLPISLIVELTPSIYHREFNHGRVEVEIHGRRALLKNFDWMSSRARCMAWLGTYEGAIRLRTPRATVRKVACILDGDPYCGYALEW